MARQLGLYKIAVFLALTGCFSPMVLASSFQVSGQDAASIGNDHAGGAASAEDASTAFYNPAGLIRIKNQQFVAGGAAALSNLRYSGTVATSAGTQMVSAEGGTYSFIPFIHYAAPITDYMVFGLSFTEPFNLNTNYGSATALRYATRLDSIQVYDLSPSLAVAFNEHFSIGAGVDVQRMHGHFDQSFVSPGSLPDTLSNNSGNSQGYGYHWGILYQFSPATRVGFSYASQVVHQLEGSSKLLGPLAGGINAAQFNDTFKARITLPPTTTLSGFHVINSSWDVMGSIAYTQWDVTNEVTLTNLMGVQGGVVRSNLQQNLIQAYRNTWNYTAGANYHVNEKWLVRTGLGWDESPTNNKYRNVQIPDSDQLALAIGTHYQMTTTLGVDVGWTHIFAMNTRVNAQTQSIGDQSVVTNGSVQASTDIYGLQLKWDIL